MLNLKRKTADKSTDVCFEAALGKLELIVKELEKGDLPLEESLARFAEGVGLSKICLSKLSAAENEIDKILREEHGRILEQPLDTREDQSC